MSDDIRNTGVVGVTGGLHVSTAAEAAIEAGRSQNRPSNPTEALRTYLKQAIADANLPDHHKTMARMKADELVFWISAGLARNE